MLTWQGWPELGGLHTAQHHHLSGAVWGLSAELSGRWKNILIRYENICHQYSGHKRMRGLDMDGRGQWASSVKLRDVFLRGDNYGVSKFHQEWLNEIFILFWYMKTARINYRFSYKDQGRSSCDMTLDLKENNLIACWLSGPPSCLCSKVEECVATGDNQIDLLPNVLEVKTILNW